MSGSFGVPVVTCSCAFFFCTRGCGCGVHPAFPAPSIFSGVLLGKTRAIPCRENAESYPLSSVMPRHRASPSASPMTGSGGASSTPRLIDSNHWRLWNTGSPGPVYAKASTGLSVLGSPKLLAKAASRAKTRAWLFEINQPVVPDKRAPRARSGTHNHRYLLLRQAGATASASMRIGGYGSRRSPGRQPQES